MEIWERVTVSEDARPIRTSGRPRFQERWEEQARRRHAGNDRFRISHENLGPRSQETRVTLGWRYGYSIYSMFETVIDREALVKIGWYSKLPNLFLGAGVFVWAVIFLGALIGKFTGEFSFPFSLRVMGLLGAIPMILLAGIGTLMSKWLSTGPTEEELREIAREAVAAMIASEPDAS